jgi:beta-aspartyl-dipeptidase (metallo-type)
VPPVPLSRFTRAGVTTVVGVLGTDDLTRTPAEVVAAARGLEAEGISAWCYTGGYHLPPATVTGSVRGDIVHVDRVIGVGEVALSDHRSSQPTFDELVKLGAEAHVGGLMTGKAGSCTCTSATARAGSPWCAARSTRPSCRRASGTPRTSTAAAPCSTRPSRSRGAAARST